MNDLGAGYVAGPVETLAFIATNYEYIVFIYNDNLAFGDFPIVNLEGGPTQSLKIVKSMLIQLCKVEKLLRETVGFARFGDALIEKLLESLILCRDCSQLVTQVSYTIMIMTLVRMPDILALIATEDYCRAIALMFEDVRVGVDLFAAAISVAALEFYFCQQIPGDSIDLIKLRVRATERAMIRILSEPVSLAVGAYGFLADLALEWVLEYVVADAAYQLRQERCHIRLIVDVVLLVHVARGARGRGLRAGGG